MIIYFVKSVPECGKGILEISSVELWLSERLQLTSLFHLPDTVSTFLPWVFIDVTCKAACNKRHLSCLREFLQSPIYHCYLTLHSCHSYLSFLCSTLDFRGLFQASFTHSAQGTQSHMIPGKSVTLCAVEVKIATHGYFSASMHWWICVLSVSFSPDAFALLYSSLSSSQSAFIMHLMYRYFF